MNIWYVTMFFPKHSETFACTEVRAVRRLGSRVAVHALMPARRETPKMLAEHDLLDLELTHTRLADLLAGLWLAVARFGLLLELLAAIFRWSWTSPKHLLMSLPFIPRTLQLYARLEKDPPDVLHLFWGHYPALLGLLVARHQPKVVISMFLSTYDLVKGYGPSTPAARRADVVRIHAEVNRPDLLRLGVAPDHIFTCYRGIETPGAQGSPERIQRRVVIASRLIADKGVDQALRAFAEAHQHFSDASLVILGEGPAQARLERLCEHLGIADGVRFYGHVEYARVFAEMNQAEAFMLLSRYEAERLPNAVKEAMWCRCVPIVSPTPGIEELVDDGKNGFIVSDAAAAGQRLTQIFSDPSGAETLAAAAQDKIQQRFDVDACMGEMHARWQQLIDEAS